MDNTILLTILSDHLHGRKTTLPADTDLAALAELARRHQVDGIVYMQCGSPPIPSMAEAYSAAAYYYANRTRAMAAVAEAFAEPPIPFFTVKGLNVAKCYPVPALRTMGDCDIVVPPSHFHAAMERMQSIGFESESETVTHEWSGTGRGIHVEVHDQLVQNVKTVSAAQAAFFNDFMPYVTDGVLDRNFHYLFLLAHLRKHWVGSGAGVRQFFDLAAILQNGEPLDFEWIEEKLALLGLTGLAHICFSLIERWFSVEVPVEFDRLGDEDAARVTEIVLQNGVFGEGDAHDGQRSRYAMTRGPLWLKNLLFLIRSVFLPYKELKRYPGIAYLDGRPWLLPAAWVHRFFLLLKRRDTAKTRETLEQNIISHAELDERKAYLHDLGIE